MSGPSSDWDWGSWVLGDLADCVRRAADLLGGTFDLVGVTARPPTLAGELPRVRVVVTDPHTSFRLRSQLRDGDVPAHFVGRPTNGSWRAEVEALDLTVAVSGEEEPW